MRGVNRKSQGKRVCSPLVGQGSPRTVTIVRHFIGSEALTQERRFSNIKGTGWTCGGGSGPSVLGSGKDLKSELMGLVDDCGGRLGVWRN